VAVGGFATTPFGAFAPSGGAASLIDFNAAASLPIVGVAATRDGAGLGAAGFSNRLLDVSELASSAAALTAAPAPIVGFAAARDGAAFGATDFSTCLLDTTVLASRVAVVAAFGAAAPLALIGFAAVRAGVPFAPSCLPCGAFAEPTPAGGAAAPARFGLLRDKSVMGFPHGKRFAVGPLFRHNSLSALRGARGLSTIARRR
jgi:hypothetical protein